MRLCKALFVAHYHNHWRIGICASFFALCLPYTLNVLWIRFSGRSLLYPVAAVVLAGVIGLWFVHRYYSGPTLEDDDEEALVRKMMEDFKPTWVDRATAICTLLGIFRKRLVVTPCTECE